VRHTGTGPPRTPRPGRTHRNCRRSRRCRTRPPRISAGRRRLRPGTLPVPRCKRRRLHRTRPDRRHVPGNRASRRPKRPPCPPHHRPDRPHRPDRQERNPRTGGHRPHRDPRQASGPSATCRFRCRLTGRPHRRHTTRSRRSGGFVAWFTRCSSRRCGLQCRGRMPAPPAGYDGTHGHARTSEGIPARPQAAWSFPAWTSTNRESRTSATKSSTTWCSCNSGRGVGREAGLPPRSCESTESRAWTS